MRLIPAIAVCAILIAGCDRTPVPIELSGPAQGTTYSVKVAKPPAGVDSYAVRVVVDEVLQTIDLQMSGYREDSEISRFNRSTSTDWFEVSQDLATVVSAALQVSGQSQGTLDITVAPLVNLWGMGPQGEHDRWPTDTEVAEARAQVGYRNLSVREHPAALRKALSGLTVDLNAVAPGYTVDLLVARLTALGITNFMIDIGGEVRAHGRNAQGELWRIAVERPVDTDPQPYAIVQLDDAAVTTSGEYRHYIVRDGQRYSHTIDPRTGRPVQHNLASVVVVSRTALDADAWATALNVLGADEGYALAMQRQIPALFIVEHDGRLESRMTPQFRPFMAVGTK